jgi:hypothetical protein
VEDVGVAVFTAATPRRRLPPGHASASERSCAGRAGRLDPLGAFRKISGDQIIGAPAAAEVHLGSGGTYHITIGIERVQEARFIGVSVRLKSPQRVFLYEE